MSLLRYKHRLSEIADDLVSENEISKALRNYDFRQKVESLSAEFMRFTTLYWFSEVSNQVQGIELFNMYRKQLNLQGLFNDVQRDIDSAAGLLRQWDTDKQASAAHRLAVLGAVFLVVAPLVDTVLAYYRETPFKTALLFVLMIVFVTWFTFKTTPLSWKLTWRKAQRTWLPLIRDFVPLFAQERRRQIFSRATFSAFCLLIVVACAIGLLWPSSKKQQVLTPEPASTPNADQSKDADQAIPTPDRAADRTKDDVVTATAPAPAANQGGDSNSTKHTPGASASRKDHADAAKSMRKANSPPDSDASSIPGQLKSPTSKTSTESKPSESRMDNQEPGSESTSPDQEAGGIR